MQKDASENIISPRCL